MKYEITLQLTNNCYIAEGNCYIIFTWKQPSW